MQKSDSYPANRKEPSVKLFDNTRAAPSQVEWYISQGNGQILTGAGSLTPLLNLFRS